MIDVVVLNGFSSVFIIPAVVAVVAFFVVVGLFLRWMYSIVARGGRDGT